MSELMDGLTDTCLQVPVNDYAFIRTGVSNPERKTTVTFQVQSKRAMACTSGYDGEELYALTKLFPPLRTLGGTFVKCPLVEMHAQGELYVHTFSCTCAYLQCSDIYVWARPPCDLGICDVKLV